MREEFEKAGLARQVWQFFTVVPDFRSTSVRAGRRAFDWPVIIRAVNTVDAMTASVPELPWPVLQTITGRILAEVPGVCRVLYDLTPKPVGTIEGICNIYSVMDIDIFSEIRIMCNRQ